MLSASQSAGFLAGFPAGYSYRFNTNVVIGAETDISFTDYFGTRIATLQPAGTTTAYTSSLRFFGTVRGRTLRQSSTSRPL